MGILQLQTNKQSKEKIYDSRITHCLETTHFSLFESLSIVKGTCIHTLRKVQKILPFALRSENLYAVLKSYFQLPYWISNENMFLFW